MWNIVLDGDPDLPQRGGGGGVGENFPICGPTTYLICVHRGDGDPNENCAKVGHRGSGGVT